MSKTNVQVKLEQGVQVIGVSGVNVQECGAGGCAWDVPGRAWRPGAKGGRRARRDAAVLSWDLDLHETPRRRRQ